MTDKTTATIELYFKEEVTEHQISNTIRGFANQYDLQYKVVNVTYNEEETTWELCPHCEEEVELLHKFERQRCPECEKEILPCSICETRACSNCPLEQDSE